MRCLWTTASVALSRTSRKRTATSRGPGSTSIVRDDALEPFGRHVQLMRAGLDAFGRDRRRADELAIDEHLRIGHVGLDAQRAQLGRSSRRAQALQAQVRGRAPRGRVAKSAQSSVRLALQERSLPNVACPLRAPSVRHEDADSGAAGARSLNSTNVAIPPPDDDARGRRRWRECVRSPVRFYAKVCSTRMSDAGEHR